MIRPAVPLFLSLFLSVSATVRDTNFIQNTYRNGLGNITTMTWAPDNTNRLFLTIKGGAIRIIQDSLLLATPFYTFSPYTGHNETGVLGFCFDPNYAANKHVYVFYTATGSQQKIVRLTDNANVGIDTLTIKQGLSTNGANHDGGGISIGPDGKLYWGIGDLGSGVGVDLDSSLYAAKICRANLDGTPVSNNPFYNAGDGITARDYIWARGFRNPFSHTWHPVTQKMWVSDVGSNFEQIFVVDRGDHGGWNNYEGGNQPSGYILPVFSYSTNGGHGLGGCVMGGIFYNATAFPTAYRGNFFFGDYNSNKVIRLVFDANNALTDSATFLTSINGVTDVSVGPDGALYAATHQGGVYRVRYKGAGSGVQRQAGPLNGFSLSQNLPNPFTASTSIRYAIPQLSANGVAAGRVTLAVHNLHGQRVVTLHDGPARPGARTADWDGKDSRGKSLTAGIYCYQLTVRDGAGRIQFETLKRMIIVH